MLTQRAFGRIFYRSASRGLGSSAKLLNSTETHFEDDNQETHFGFQTIKASEKGQKVYSVFENVATNYDKMNDAMSMGVHRIWKDIFMCRLGPTANTNLLDMAGGTGDIAFRFLNYVKNENIEKSCHVTVSDINENMLEVGRTRSRALNHDPTLISWERADGENLHFKDESFNAYTIAFGIRNCTHVDKVLQEAYRVLQPGGRFLCMEFSQVENEVARWFGGEVSIFKFIEMLFSRLYDQYSFQVIPVMGHLLAGQWQAYQYLVESIRKFPDQETFKTMIEEAGFRQVTYENLSLGVVAIHSGFKL
jgi:2-methoxy-6-polyprenyl-1,4-benzoquinol methylase